MKDFANTALWVLVVGAVLAFLALIVWYEVTIWNECRASHSFMYCLHTLS